MAPTEYMCNSTIKILRWRLPCGPVVKTLPSNTGGASSIPGGGAKMPHVSQPINQNVKEKQYCNKFNKDFKNGSSQKKYFKNIYSVFLEFSVL